MLRPFFLVVALMALLAAPVTAQEATPAAGGQAGGMTVVASGLTNPRGFIWAADGTLYVAQAGTGGPQLGTPTAPPPVGPVSGGPSASVVRIENGCPALVAGGLPSVMTSLGDVLGAEELVVLGDQLYAAVDGGGEAHGNAAQPSGVYRILGDGTSELVADTSAWVRANPVAVLPPDFDPDAAGYGLVADEATGTFWLSDPNSGQILNVGLDGSISRIADLSDPHRVPTMLTPAPQGGVYVGFLTPAPFPDGASTVIHVAPDGTVTEDVWTGLTAVVDVAVGADGTLYAVEMSTNNLDAPPFLNFDTGRVVRQTGPDSLEEVATGLPLPITAGFGPDGALYVASPAIGADGGTGTISRLDMAAGAGATPAAAAAAPAACEPVGMGAPAAATPAA